MANHSSEGSRSSSSQGSRIGDVDETPDLTQMDDGFEEKRPEREEVQQQLPNDAAMDGSQIDDNELARDVFTNDLHPDVEPRDDDDDGNHDDTVDAGLEAVQIERDAVQRKLVEEPVRDGDPPATEQDTADATAKTVRATNSRLADLSWSELQARFEADMAEKTKAEEGLMNHFQMLTQTYLAWASIPAVKEEQRAAKRLRTRVAYVQHEEKKLEAKREYLVTVRKAFEDAFNMLEVDQVDDEP